jgi:hypothetical protein
MSPPEIYQLVYLSTYSAARVDNGLQALRAILKSSKRNNEAAQVTGYLIFDGTHFVQILEGARADVEAVYARIGGDQRHHGLKIIGEATAARRDFPTWIMGGYLRSPEEAAIFARHGIQGDLARAELTARGLIALAKDLATSRSGTPG